MALFNLVCLTNPSFAEKLGHTLNSILCNDNPFNKAALISFEILLAIVTNRRKMGRLVTGLSVKR